MFVTPITQSLFQCVQNGGTDGYLGMRERMNKAILGCQPLKPLSGDTFVKSNNNVNIKEHGDTFVKREPLVQSNEDRSKVSFGYRHALKTAWKKGMLPTVKRGLYGNKLTKNNVSLEHITPVSQGGGTVLENLALADMRSNNERGVRPIKDVVTPMQLLAYLEQFKGVKNRYINGDEYIKRIMHNAKTKWKILPEDKV